MAVTVLSTAAFAGTETKTTNENVDAKTATEQPTENHSKVDVAESIEENNGMFRKKCVYTFLE